MVTCVCGPPESVPKLLTFTVTLKVLVAAVAPQKSVTDAEATGAVQSGRSRTSTWSMPISLQISGPRMAMKRILKLGVPSGRVV